MATKNNTGNLPSMDEVLGSSNKTPSGGALPSMGEILGEESPKKKESTGVSSLTGSEPAPSSLEAQSTSSEVPAWAPADIQAKQEGVVSPVSVSEKINPKNFETKLSPTEEAKFKSWLDKNHKEGRITKGDYDFYKKNDYGYNYDFRAAFKSGEMSSVNPKDNQQHWSDIGKKPNHETFSNESIYSKQQGGSDYLGGSWDGENYIPPHPNEVVPSGEPYVWDVKKAQKELEEKKKSQAEPKAISTIETKIPAQTQTLQETQKELSEREVYKEPTAEEKLQDKLIQSVIPYQDRLAGLFARGATRHISDASRSIAILAKKIDLFGEYDDKKVDELATYKFADWLEKTVQDLTPTDRAMQESLAGKLAEAGGGLSGYVVGGLTGKALKGTSFLGKSAEWVIPAMMGAGQNGAQEYKLAYDKANDAKNLSDEEYINKYAKSEAEIPAIAAQKAELAEKNPEDVAWEIGVPSFAIGTLEGLPISRFFSRVDKATGGWGKKVLGKKLGENVDGFFNAVNDSRVAAGVMGGMEEAAQEMITQGLTNAAAGKVYDTTRSIYEGLAESGELGGILGFALNAMGVSLRKMRNNPDLKPEAKKDIDAAIAYNDKQEKLIDGVGPTEIVKPIENSDEVNKLEAEKNKLISSIGNENVDAKAASVIKEGVDKIDETIQKTKEAERKTSVEEDIKQIELNGVEEEISSLEKALAGKLDESTKALFESKLQEARKTKEQLIKTKTDESEKTSEKSGSEEIGSEKEQVDEIVKAEDGLLKPETGVEETPVISETKTEITDDTQNEIGLPGEEQIGQEPVQEKLVEGASQEEVGGDRVFQEEEVTPKKTSAVKRLIEKTTGVKPVKELITSDEKTLLKKQIRDEARGAKWGFKEAAAKGHSAMEFTNKQGAAFQERVQEILKDPNNKLRGKLSGKQVTSIVDKAGKIKSYQELHKFDDYVQKVVDNENYAEDLRKAVSDKKSIKSKNKKGDRKSGALANNIETIKAFLNINPSEVENMQEYLDVADKIRQNQKSVKIKKGERGYEAVNENLSITNKEIEDYVSKTLNEIEGNKKAALEEDYNYLVEQGVIDKNTMSLKDMESIVDAAEQEEKSIDSILDDLTPTELQEKTKALKSLVDYKVMDLDSHVKSKIDEGAEFTKAEKSAADGIMNIDTSELSIKQLTRLNSVINNIINNDNFAGAGVFEDISNAQNGIKNIREEIKKSGVRLSDISGVFAESLANKSQMFAFLAKADSLSAEIKRQSGVDAVYNGNARTRIEQELLFKDYDNIKSRASKDIDSPENRIRRAVYAEVIKNYGGNSESMKVDFDRGKSYIAQTRDKLLDKKSTEDEVTEGEIIAKVYDELLEGAESIDDVKNRMNELNPDNIKLVDLFLDKYSEKVDGFEEQSLINGNADFERVNNYTSTKMKALSYSERASASDIIDRFKKTFFNEDLHSKKSKTRISKTKSKNLKSGRVLDLDFDRVQFERFFESNYDFYTSKAISQVAEFFANPNTNELLGGKENADVILNTVKSSVKKQVGDYIPTDKFTKNILKAANIMQAKAVRMSLYSPVQFLKQYPSVALRTIFTLGSDADLFFKAFRSSNNLDIFKKYNIGQRGEAMAGLNRESIIKSVDKMILPTSPERIIRKVDSIADKVSKALAAPLVKSDVAVARTSWKAYYMKSLREQGLDIGNIDWEAEGVNPNEKAASYAELMVEKSQAANDPSSMGNIYKNNGSGLSKAIMPVIAPFNSFALTQRVSITNDMKKLMFGENKREAARSLAGTGTEILAFNAVKAALIAPLVTWAATELLQYFKIKDEEERDSELDKLKIKVGESEIETTQAMKKYFSNVFSDVFFSGTGSAPQSVLQNFANMAYSSIAMEEKMIETRRGKRVRKIDEPDLYFNYPKDWTSYLGVYGILPAKVIGILENMDYYDGKADKVVKLEDREKGTPEIKEEVELTDNEKALMRISLFMDVLAISGLSDAEINHINDKVKREFYKNLNAQYKGSEFKVKSISDSPESQYYKLPDARKEKFEAGDKERFEEIFKEKKAELLNDDSLFPNLDKKERDSKLNVMARNKAYNEMFGDNK